MKKKILSIVLILSLVFSMSATLSVTVSAETLTCGNFEYEVLDDGTVFIEEYKGSASELIVPNAIEGKQVAGICIFAFYGCKSLTSITIPDSISTIKDNAFSDCDRLTNINVSPDNKAFCSEDGVLFNKDKTELIQYPMGRTDKTYSIPESVTSIGNRAFGNCAELTGIIIPNGLTSIGDYAFFGCKPLADINIPNSVTNIGTFAFCACESLKSVTIPDSVKNLELFSFGFYYSSELTKIPNFHINCYKGTAGEKYAIGNGFDYTLINEGGAVKYGDVNGDGKVTAADVLLIRKSIAGQNVTLNKIAADVNCDDKLTAADVLLVRKFIAGQNVTLGK